MNLTFNTSRLETKKNSSYPEPNWGPIGQLVYLRTYARPLGDRREYWYETVERVKRYSAKLGPIVGNEVAELGDSIFNFDTFVAGRTLWVADTPVIDGNGIANFNCAFTTIQSPDDFGEIVLLLMSGSGVGGRVSKQDAKRLNEVASLGRTPKLVIKPYEWLGYNHPMYSEKTFYTLFDGVLNIRVGDSREGWSDAIKLFLALVGKAEVVSIDVDSVRPNGELLKRFGGRASGPGALLEFFRWAHLSLFAKNRPRGWTPVKMLDVLNLIGRTVVSGGTRRSALIALSDDEEFAKAKTGQWATPDQVEEWQQSMVIPEDQIPPWRVQSNNTVLYDSSVSRETLDETVSWAINKGEPGFLNIDAAKQRREDFEGVNPCGEILLRSKGLCNLTSINLVNHVVNGELDYEKLLKSAWLLTRHSMRITNVDLGPRLKSWQRVLSQDRLIGVSLTGVMDAYYLLNSEAQNTMWNTLAKISAYIEKTAQAYAADMGIPKPLLRTTIKPEGTQSLMPGVSAGIHNSYAPYYIRRVRISDMDPLAEALIEQGFFHERDLFNNSTLVFSFPVKSPTPVSANQVPASEMLFRYLLSMEKWTEHNTSITINVGSGEIGDFTEELYRNWGSVVAVSILPKMTTVYPQAPLEEIDKNTYEKLVASSPVFDRRYLDRIEAGVGASVSEVDSDCDSGLCPVR